jgi:Methyltransferase domain
MSDKIGFRLGEEPYIGTGIMVTEDDVRWAYRLFLDREPESYDVIDNHLRNTTSIEELRRLFLTCPEYQSKNTITVGSLCVPRYWPVTGEPGKNFSTRLDNGFFSEFLSGEKILDVGFKGYGNQPVPILPHAIGVDTDYPGYDGLGLPFADRSIDAVFSSHTLEHVIDYITIIRDWHRVIKIDGFIVCIVPHQFLYEKKRELPSMYNSDHKRFYTPASLLCEFEEALEPNSYRVRHLADNDIGYNYDIGPASHAAGAYEIELVIQKIERPAWGLA